MNIRLFLTGIFFLYNSLTNLKLAECSKNTVLMSLISSLTPDVISISDRMNVERDGRPPAALAEHQSIVKAIQLRDPLKAVAAMEVHMQRARKQEDKLEKHYLP